MLPLIATTILPLFKDYIKNPFNKKNLNLTLIIIIIILVLIGFKTCKSTAELKAKLKHQENIASNNYAALNDTIKKLYTKSGQLEYSKTILYADAEQLKTLNAELQKELKDTKGKTKVIVKTETVVEYVPVTVPNTVQSYGNGKYGLKFATSYKDSGLISEIEGVSGFHITQDYKVIPDSTKITKNKLVIDIVYGMRERDKKIEIFARSKSPLISFNEIEGAYVPTDGNSVLPNDPAPPPAKNKKWMLGPQLGYTYNFTASSQMYNVNLSLLHKMGNRFIVGGFAGLQYQQQVARPDVRAGAMIQYFLFKW
jgi:hypothetical protein